MTATSIWCSCAKASAIGFVRHHRLVLGHSTDSAALERITRKGEVGAEDLEWVLDIRERGPPGAELDLAVVVQSRETEIPFGREVVVHAPLADAGELANLSRTRGAVTALPHQLGHRLHQPLPGTHVPSVPGGIECTYLKVHKSMSSISESL